MNLFPLPSVRPQALRAVDRAPYRQHPFHPNPIRNLARRET